MFDLTRILADQVLLESQPPTYSMVVSAKVIVCGESAVRCTWYTWCVCRIVNRIFHGGTITAVSAWLSSKNHPRWRVCAAWSRPRKISRSNVRSYSFRSPTSQWPVFSQDTCPVFITDTSSRWVHELAKIHRHIYDWSTWATSDCNINNHLTFTLYLVDAFQDVVICTRQLNKSVDSAMHVKESQPQYIVVIALTIVTLPLYCME